MKKNFLELSLLIVSLNVYDVCWCRFSGSLSYGFYLFNTLLIWCVSAIKPADFRTGLTWGDTGVSWANSSIVVRPPILKDGKHVHEAFCNALKSGNSIGHRNGSAIEPEGIECSISSISLPWYSTRSRFPDSCLAPVSLMDRVNEYFAFEHASFPISMDFWSDIKVHLKCTLAHKMAWHNISICKSRGNVNVIEDHSPRFRSWRVNLQFQIHNYSVALNKSISSDLSGSVQCTENKS